MRMKRNIACGVALLLAAAMMTSCGQDVVEETGVAEQQEAQRVTTVADLTQQLRAYDAALMGGTRAGESAWADPSGMAVVNARMGIAMADAGGAIRGGLRGGVKGAIVGAVASSLSALLDRLFSASVLQPVTPTVFAINGTPTLSDSVGYYHNVVEAAMYKMDACSNKQSSNLLLGRADRIMKSISTGYNAGEEFTNQQKRDIASDLDAFRAADRTDLTFDGYCSLLKQLDTESSEYIDFAAEYLFTVYYGNVDIDDYTEEVLFMISNSNADVEDVGVLNRCIQVAHASTIFSANIK